MIAIIRIRGRVKIPEEVKNTLYRLRLRHKYTCVILHEKPETLGMLKMIRDFVSYGKIDKSTLKKLLEKRGVIIDKKKKVDFEKLSEEIFNAKVDKKMQTYNLKPFFRLHPPRGGIKSKLHYPKGVLGENKEINKLIERML
ncbi:MAG: uL30 family ribosomal protein [archaeon]